MKHDNKKSYAWNAGYHMTEARDLRKRADRHEAGEAVQGGEAVTPDRCPVCDRAECRRDRFAEPWDAATRAEAADCHAHAVDWRARYFTSHADGFRAGFRAAIAWAIDRSRIPSETMTEAVARLLAEEGKKR